MTKLFFCRLLSNVTHPDQNSEAMKLAKVNFFYTNIKLILLLFIRWKRFKLKREEGEI